MYVSRWKKAAKEGAALCAVLCIFVSCVQLYSYDMHTRISQSKSTYWDMFGYVASAKDKHSLHSGVINE
jgi:hypothetical protein